MTYQKRSPEIGIGHELVHGQRSMSGTATEYTQSTTHTYIDVSGNTRKQVVPVEELETIGITGHGKSTENKLRKEQGLNKRGAY